MRIARVVASYLAVMAVMIILPTAGIAGPESCHNHGKSAKSLARIKVGTVSSGAPVEIFNWDFEQDKCPYRTDVGWPVDLVFWNNASRKAIKAGLESYYPYGKPFASVEYAWMNDAAGPFWASDQGKKTKFESEGTSDEHYRIYAYSEREYSVQWGYFVVGTMHKDYNEPGLFNEPKYGNSEAAETALTTAVLELDHRGELKWTVAPDAYNVKNEEYGRSEEGAKYKVENDGLATEFKMP